MLTRVAGQQRVRASSTDTFPAPAKGWVQSGNIVLAGGDQAEVLDNFFPTAQGARLRGGISEYADMGARAVRLFGYNSGTSELFGSTPTKIFDLGRLDGGGSNSFGDLEGLASGDWSATQISTSGGQFLVAVNGVNSAIYYDGVDWNPITDSSIEDLDFDAETAAFSIGETVTGGTSGATATIRGIVKTSATAGTLKIDGKSGTFQNDETITDGSSGSATADGAASAASSITITNVATSSLKQVWLFKERLFFVEKDSTSVWYLPVESIGGAATEIDLGSVFRKGGNLLFGATWSLDSGSGLDDVCLFVSDLGEIAVYEGTNPDSASTWSLVGVYDIGKPLNKHAVFKAGGDLAILTEDGIIPVSEALKRDRAALQTVAVSYPIEDAWTDAVTLQTSSYQVSVSLWQSKALLLIGTPKISGGKNVAFAANARTGAWGRVTGWDVRCSAVSGDSLYFGDGNGKVFQADTGGTDDGSAYSGIYVPKFTNGQVTRSANASGLTYRATTELTFDLGALSDYQTQNITTPGPAETEAGATWGSGVWGTFKWGNDADLQSFTTWQAAYASGYALAPYVAITSNQTEAIDFEILVSRIRYEEGYPL